MFSSCSWPTVETNVTFAPDSDGEAPAEIQNKEDVMADSNTGPQEAIRGLIEGVIGKIKEIIGTVLGRGDITEEGKAQQDKAQAERDAAKKEAEAEKARATAKAQEKRERSEQ